MSKMIIEDKVSIRDTIARDNGGVQHTMVVIKDKGTGKILYRGSNRIMVTGSEFNALKDFTFNENWSETPELSNMKSYDSVLSTLGTYDPKNGSAYQLTTGILSCASGDPAAYRYLARRVCLFCVGIDGCGIEASRVYKVNNTKWIAPTGYARYDPGTGTIDGNITNCLIPFRVTPSKTEDLTINERETYFGRLINSDGSIGYYFKKFDTTPTLIRRYEDGSSNLNTPSTLDVWKDTRASEAEVVVQLKMSITPDDCREYFERTTGINTAKINCISLCTAVPYSGRDSADYAMNDDAKTQVRTFYTDIKPFSRFNFPNSPLIDTSKGIDIEYYLYY